MRSIQISAACMGFLLLTACSDEPDTSETQVQTPITIEESADRLPPVELKIPGVDGDTDVTIMPAEDDVIPAPGQVAEETLVPGQPVPTIDIPRPLILSDVVHSRFSNLLEGPSGAPILDAVFYPLGWSPDGKLAYAIEPPDEAVGSYFLNIYIQDLVTDEILWKDNYQSVPESDQGPQSFAAYWMANEKAINEQLEKFTISKVENSALYAGPISQGDDSLKYNITKKLSAVPDFGNVAMVNEYQVIVQSAQRGSKTVHREKYDKISGIMDVDVIGYLRGSDEERVALLVAGVKRGWEGPPHVTWFKVIGTNLIRGFKKGS